MTKSSQTGAFLRLTAKRHRISRGIDEGAVQPNRERKSVGAEDTFAEDIFDFEAAKSELKPLADKVWRHCEAKLLSGRTVTLKVKFGDFKQITRSRSFTAPLSSQQELRQAGIDLMRGVYPLRTGVRLVGISISNLEENATGTGPQLQLGLAV